MQIRLVYMTAGSADEAGKIAHGLVAAGLAACVNILPHMSSIYLWEGKLQQDSEVVMIAKTTADRVAELMDRVRSLHSYTVPCIVSLAVEDGHTPFLEWVAASVKKQ
jgi:periplasmic divalent cation tolerance protein